MLVEAPVVRQQAQPVRPYAMECTSLPHPVIDLFSVVVAQKATLCQLQCSVTYMGDV